MTETSDAAAELYRQDLDVDQERTRLALAEWLADHPEVVRIEAEYNGSGDSGDVENVTLTLADGTTNDDLPAGLEDILWSVAYTAHPGFENNEGGCGTVVIEGGRVHIQHTWFVEITEDALPVDWALQ